MNELKSPALDSLSNDAADASERRKAWDVEQSWIVEAPAGSGKTELLMQRFLLLLSRVEQPEQILAITFTRKATAEMRDRILESLRNAESDDTLPEVAAHKLRTRQFAKRALDNDAKRGWNILSQPERLNIRTIDSLCGEIVSQLPLLSQFGGQLSPAESTAALYRQAAQSALEEMGGSDPRLRQAADILLLHLGNRLDDAVDLLAEMLDTRDQWGRIFPIDRELSDQELNLYIAKRLEKTLQEAVDSSLAKILNQFGSEFLAQAFELGNHAAQVLESLGRKNILRPLLGGPSIPPATHEYLDCWKSLGYLFLTGEGMLRRPSGVNISLGFATNDAKKTLFLDLLTCARGNAEIVESVLTSIVRLPPCVYSEKQKEILRASFLLLRQAVAHLKVAFAESGSADFTEFLLAANEALRSDSSSLAFTFGAKILHLLVDEMQDTSVSQFHLLSKLVESWDGCSQTVFLVGDPKQSIYRFRNAEVGLFTQAQKEGLGGVMLQPIQLSSNFRSRQSLVEETNAIFSRIFDVKAECDPIDFAPSEAAHKEEQIQRVFWHPSVHRYNTKQEENDPDASLAIEDPHLAEAREVCDVIEHHRACIPMDGPAPSMAVLIRARSHVGPILREMRNRGIPYHAVEMDTLADRQPVLDLAAITRCLLHPADRIAWLAILRAPWCGLALSDLLALCGNDDSAWNGKTVSELFRERAEALSADGQQRADRTLKVLEAAQKASSHERLAMLVERVWRTLGGPACIPKAEIPSAMEFFRMLDRLEDESGWPSASTLENQMRKLFAPSDGGHNSPVEVLTLFKAKGLEWDIILIPGLHRYTQGERTKLIEWMEQLSDDLADNSILLAPVKHVADEREPIGTWVRSRVMERNRAELKRLLYVGCTRARRELHLFGQCWEGQSGALNRPKDRSLLRTAWPVGEGIFRDQLLQSNVPLNVTEMPLRRVSDEEFPARSPGVLDTVAAEVHVAPGIPGAIRLSNFQRLATGWRPSIPPPDVPLGSSANEITTEFNQTGEPGFTRPQGSWRARVFGTTLHAFLEPLAEILKREQDGLAITEAIEQLAHPIRLHLQRAGHAQTEADREARRIVTALENMTGDEIARWLLTASPKNGSQAFYGFEIPLTAFIHNSIRSIRVDRMFLAGNSPLAPGDDFLWIVDFKTAGYHADRTDEFLHEQKALYSGQMQTYAEAAQTAYPERKEIRLGLYYPLLRKLVWWRHEPQSSGS